MTSGAHKSKSRSAETKNKVIHQSDSTHAKNFSTGMHTKVTNTHTVPSAASLPTIDHLKANDSIQKVVSERLSELKHLNSTGMSQQLVSQRGGVEVFVKHKVRWPHEYVLAGNNKECVTYNQLTMGQWMAVFFKSYERGN